MYLAFVNDQLDYRIVEINNEDNNLTEIGDELCAENELYWFFDNKPILIKEALEDKKLKLNTLGHHVNMCMLTLEKLSPDFMKRLIDRDRTSRLCSLIANTFIPVDEPSFNNNMLTCYNCGKRLEAIIDEKQKEILIIVPKHYSEENTSVDITSKEVRCIAEEIDKLKCFSSTIKVESGQLIFVNYFDNDKIEDCPDELQYNNEYSLDVLLGRYNRTKYLADQNVGFGQMGNMSLSVWKRKDGKEVLLTDPYMFEEKPDKEFQTNYTHLGIICLAMWRWMCADRSVLDSLDIQYDVKEEPSNDYEEVIRPMLFLVNGLWNIIIV